MGEKFILYAIVKPKNPGENPRIYYVDKNHFTSLLSEAHIFENIKDAYESQIECSFETNIEKILNN